MEIEKSSDTGRGLMWKPTEPMEKASVQYVSKEMLDDQLSPQEDFVDANVFKDIGDEIDYCQDEEIIEALEGAKRVAEKAVEVAAVAVPGGQGVAAEMAAKEVAKTAAKEVGKAVVKEVAKSVTSEVIDATESESLQKVKSTIVEAASKTVDKGVGELPSSQRQLPEAKGMPPNLRLPKYESTEEDGGLGLPEVYERKPGSEVVKEWPSGESHLEKDFRSAGDSEPLKAESESETKEKFPPNTTVEIDGKKCETDDNGDIYAVDGKLLPNVEYSLNGFKYRTDEHGRIVHAEGEVKLSDKERDPMPEISNKDKRDTDDKGHVIGHQIGGLEKIGNLVPQDFNLNRGEYKKLENELARLAREGHDIKVEVSLKYKDGSDRPDTFRVKYTVDGKTYVKIFKNESSKNGGNQ